MKINGFSEKEWVNISNFLPEDGKMVLVTLETMDGLMVEYTCYDDDFGFACVEKYDPLNVGACKVIAWMYPPEPYKK